jgi:Cu(I)/Ag(I) efflux system membrane fusion protein
MLIAREVTTGLVADREIEILEGLDEGERIVSAANFLIDAESSMGSAIDAMPGMEMDVLEPVNKETKPDQQGHTTKGK